MEEEQEQEEQEQQQEEEEQEQEQEEEEEEQEQEQEQEQQQEEEEEEKQEDQEELEELEEEQEELELEFVCCRRRPRRRERSWSSCVACCGGFRRENSRFGSRGLASTICNNLITGLLSLSKSHTPALSLLCPEPKPRAFGPAARPALLFAQIQACRRGHVPFSCRTSSLAALHGTAERRRYSGGEWARLQELFF